MQNQGENQNLNMDWCEFIHKRREIWDVTYYGFGISAIKRSGFAYVAEKMTRHGFFMTRECCFQYYFLVIKKINKLLKKKIKKNKIRK